MKENNKTAPVEKEPEGSGLTVGIGGTGRAVLETIREKLGSLFPEEKEEKDHV